MKKSFKVVIISLLVFAVIALAVFYAFTHNIPVLNPKGMIASKERHLIITTTSLMLIVVIPVFIFTLFFAWRYRASNDKARHEPDWEHNNIAEVCWWGVPFVIIVILAVITWKTSHELNPFKPLESDKKPIEVQVVALEWKWLFIYPEQGIATINYLQIPEKTPINFTISADAPMNSFWIPALGGQIYAMPAMKTKLHLIADSVGTYRGASSNFSGKGFAGMKFQVVSTTEDDFHNWVGSARQSPNRLDMNVYNDLVAPSEDNPVTSYVLMQHDLFDRIVMKYSPPIHQE